MFRALFVLVSTNGQNPPPDALLQWKLIVRLKLFDPTSLRPRHPDGRLRESRTFRRLGLGPIPPRRAPVVRLRALSGCALRDWRGGASHRTHIPRRGASSQQRGHNPSKVAGGLHTTPTPAYGRRRRVRLPPRLACLNLLPCHPACRPAVGVLVLFRRVRRDLGLLPTRTCSGAGGAARWRPAGRVMWRIIRRHEGARGYRDVKVLKEEACRACMRFALVLCRTCGVCYALFCAFPRVRRTIVCRTAAGPCFGSSGDAIFLLRTPPVHGVAGRPRHVLHVHVLGIQDVAGAPVHQALRLPRRRLCRALQGQPLFPAALSNLPIRQALHARATHRRRRRLSRDGPFLNEIPLQGTRGGKGQNSRWR